MEFYTSNGVFWETGVRTLQVGDSSKEEHTRGFWEVFFPGILTGRPLCKDSASEGLAWTLQKKNAT